MSMNTIFLVLAMSASFTSVPVVHADDHSDCEKGSLAKCQKYATEMDFQRKRTDALGFFAKSCSGGNGNGAACVPLSEWLREEGEYQQAKALMTASCAHGYKAACNRVMFNFTAGAARRSLMRNECDKDNYEACLSLGVGTGGGDYTAQERADLKKACSGGEAGGCMVLSTESNSKDALKLKTEYRSRGLSLLQKECEKGSVQSCLNRARENDPDPATAKKVLSEACEFGDAVGCYDEASAEDALGNKERADKAREQAKIIEQARCDQGSVSACHYTKCSENPTQSLKDGTLKCSHIDDRMRTILNKGCDQGDNNMCYQLEYDAADVKDQEKVVKKYHDSW